MPKIRLGDTVLFHFGPDEDVSAYNNSRTHPATVVAVWSDDCVNLKVTPDGKAHSIWETSVNRSAIVDGQITRGFSLR